MTQTVIDNVMNFKRSQVSKAGRPSKMTNELAVTCKALRQKGCKISTIFYALTEQKLMPYETYVGFSLAYKKTLKK